MANKVQITVTADNKASPALNQVSASLGGLETSSSKASVAGNILEGVVTGLTATLSSFALSIAQSAFDSVTNFFEDSVTAANEFQKSMISLEVMAPRFGISMDDAKEAAERLGNELRIGPGAAAEALQNLFKSGLNLDQSIDLMRRFTNEAITGKSAHKTLSDAVRDLSFAYATNNSALGDANGISENFSNIIQDGTRLLLEKGVAMSDITEEMAKYEGMIALTNLTLGASDKFIGTFSDKQAELNLRIGETQRKLGEHLQPILADLLDLFLEIFDEVSPYLSQWADELFPEIGRVVKEDIIPWVKELIEDFKSESFKKNLEDVEKIFSDIGGVVEGIATAINDITSTPGFNSLLEFGYGAAQQFAKAPMHEQLLGGIGLPMLRQAGLLPKYAKGGDFVTSGPQAIIVGDNPGGQERVEITPLSSPNINGPKGNTINQNVYISNSIDLITFNAQMRALLR